MHLLLLNILQTVYLEDGEMANIRLHKSMKCEKIKDDSSVEPYIQELQMNLEQIEKGAMITLC
jgi:glucosamine--fructose-6-phosphate aminotransferase (isomerizing)